MVQLFIVAKGSAEHDAVAALFGRTLPQLTIDEISRVENGAQVGLQGVKECGFFYFSSGAVGDDSKSFLS